MKQALALMVVASIGCGTILNGAPATIVPPPGASVDGVAGPVTVSKVGPHQVVYPDGRQCIIQPRIGVLYVVGDIVFFFVGILVDAVTGGWNVLDASSCPGVIIN
jgi:hypothetical protein